MKKFIAIILSLTLVFPMLTGCGNITKVDTLKVGLIQLVEHSSLDEIRTAFTKQITENATTKGLNIEIDYQNAQNDMSMINTICQKFVADKVDLIVAIATPAAQGAASAVIGTDIPVIFSAVTDPVAAQLVLDINAPEGNITGTSDAIPVEMIFDLADELTPNIKKYGVVYNLGEINSVSVVKQAKEYLESKGLELIESPITSSTEVQTAAQNLVGKCDGIFVPIDNTVANAMSILAGEAINAKIPVYAAADSLVLDGALASVGVNYTNLGKQTADMALKAITGTAIRYIPVEVLKDNSVTVNKDTATAIGVDVSKYAK
ncbi:MAG: ABC transporter substrate-binding protein [Oscillospiraceae bacterium]